MRLNFKNKTNTYIIFNIVLLIILLLISFPLYKFLIKITGYDRTTYLSDNEYIKDSLIISPENKSPKIIDRSLKILFKAKVDDLLNWEFRAIQNNAEVKIGENKIIKFEGKNLSNKTIKATAEFYAEPEKILPYLIKTECFCFIEQTLEPGESQVFSLVFYIDPSLDLDKNLSELKEIEFTYKFFKSEN